MRILMLNHEFPPVGGGAARASYEIARHLVRAGHAVTVVSAGAAGLPGREHCDGVEVHRVYGSRKGPLDNNLPVTLASYLLLGTRAAAALARQRPFDVMHAFFTVPAGLSGVLLKHAFGTPLVVSLRGSDVPHHNPGDLNLAVRLAAPVARSVWRRADRVVSLSRALRATAARTAPWVSRDVITNGVDADRFQPRTSAPPDETPHLISVSRLVRCKGLEDLLQAAARIRAAGRPFRLSVVGDGPDRGRLSRIATDLGLDPCVRFTGHVPYEALPERYREADAFVLPTLTEAFGQVFAEAMACGLPVVGTRVGALPEILPPDRVAALVPPGDVDALARAILRLLDSPDRGRAIGRQNARHVRERFSWPAVARQYAALYADVIARAGRLPAHRHHPPDRPPACVESQGSITTTRASR